MKQCLHSILNNVYNTSTLEVHELQRNDRGPHVFPGSAGYQLDTLDHFIGLLCGLAVRSGSSGFHRYAGACAVLPKFAKGAERSLRTSHRFSDMSMNHSGWDSVVALHGTRVGELQHLHYST